MYGNEIYQNNYPPCRRSADGAFSLDGEEFQEGSSVLLPPSASGALRASGAWLLLTEF